MECYSHHGESAVAVCRVCGRGLCEDCAMDDGYGLSCRGSCQERAAALKRMIDLNMAMADRNAALLANAPAAYLGQTVLMGVMGAIMLGFGLLVLLVTPVGAVLVLLGLLFLGYAAFSYRQGRKIPKPDRSAGLVPPHEVPSQWRGSA